MLEALTDLLDSAVDEPRDFEDVREAVRMLFSERLPAADILTVAPLLPQRTILPKLVEKYLSGTISRSDMSAYVKARSWPVTLCSTVLALDGSSLGRLARGLEAGDWVLVKAIVSPPVSDGP